MSRALPVRVASGRAAIRSRITMHADAAMLALAVAVVAYVLMGGGCPATPVCGAWLPASEPDHAHQILPLQ
jgi:hypothetical protein